MNNIAMLAAQDQAHAKEREFDRKAQKVAIWGMAFAIILAIYSLLAIMGYLPATPWSAMGKQ